MKAKQLKLMNSGNTVFFSTANSGYAEYALTSLLTIRKHVPDANLYLLSSGLSMDERSLAARFGVEVHEVDLSSVFYKTWDYPIDCYYMFAGPEILGRAGYKYSVYVDGDTLCKSSPFIAAFEGVTGVAAEGKDGIYTSIFGDDWPSIRREWDMPDSVAKRQRVNAGIVYFNNESMSKFNLLDKASKVFDSCVTLDIPRKGDDSLFSLMQYIYREEVEVSFIALEYNYVLQFTRDRVYPISGLVFFHFSIDKPWKNNPYEHEDDSLMCYNPAVQEWLSMYGRVNRTNYISLTKKPLLALMNRVGKVSKKIQRKSLRLTRDAYYWASGRKLGLVQRISNVKKRPLRLYYWQDHASGIRNFGDEVTQDIIFGIFGYRSELASVDDAEVAGVGSILEIIGERTSKAKLYVWGAGFIQPQDDMRPYSEDSFTVCAVRGEETLSRLGDGIDKDSIAVGDPGLMASVLYQAPEYSLDKIGVVVHYAEVDLPVVLRLRSDPRFIVINALDSPSVVASRIASCKLVLSSSLHGLIFADSYGVPNSHIYLSDRLTGGDYKFEDYYSATGRPYRFIDEDDIFSNEVHAGIVIAYTPVVGLKDIQRKLVRSFPRNLR